MNSVFHCCIDNKIEKKKSKIINFYVKVKAGKRKKKALGVGRTM
jgi:hypothetical protein